MQPPCYHLGKCVSGCHPQPLCWERGGASLGSGVARHSRAVRARETSPQHPKATGRRLQDAGAHVFGGLAVGRASRRGRLDREQHLPFCPLAWGAAGCEMGQTSRSVTEAPQTTTQVGKRDVSSGHLDDLELKPHSLFFKFVGGQRSLVLKIFYNDLLEEQYLAVVKNTSRKSCGFKIKRGRRREHYHPCDKDRQCQKQRTAQPLRFWRAP